MEDEKYKSDQEEYEKSRTELKLFQETKIDEEVKVSVTTINAEILPVNTTEEDEEYVSDDEEKEEEEDGPVIDWSSNEVSKEEEILYRRMMEHRQNIEYENRRAREQCIPDIDDWPEEIVDTLYNTEYHRWIKSKVESMMKEKKESIEKLGEIEYRWEGNKGKRMRYQDQERSPQYQEKYVNDFGWYIENYYHELFDAYNKWYK
jgi:hypothetical protein